MNYRNSTIGTCCLFAVLLGMALLASCGKVDDKVDVPKVELGAVTKEYVVEAEAGQVEVEVYANLPYNINYITQAPWTTLSTTRLSGDSKFTVDYEYNEEFPRMVVLSLTNATDSRSDTIYIKQKGLIQPTLAMSNTSVIAAGAGGESLSDIDCNIPMEDIAVDILYPDETDTDWVSGIDIDLDAQKLILDTGANSDQDQPRTAIVRMSYVDGWGDKVSLQVNITQRNAQEGLGREVTFDELRGMYGNEDGEDITEYLTITGVVVSDKNSGNAGENEQTTTSAINYNGAKTTLYLQNSDGSMGFCVETVTPDDNIFARYSTVQFLLKGAVMTYKENPDRYIISKITSAMATSNVAGTSANVPLKEKYMNELTDDDMYTWVTLKDCEIPVRKGALVPANEGYTTATNAHRLSKYPMLIRDRNGDYMYMYTNTTCRYRNDGTCLPYGSGKLSGVVVHEKFTRFEYEDAEDEEDYGNIGDYQLRHMSKADIWGQMEKSVENSFSALLTEYRFQNSGYDGTSKPTYGTNGWLTHTCQEKYTGVPNENTPYFWGATYQVPFFGAGEYCYLGPIGNGVNPDFGTNKGNVNGCGIVLDLAREHYNTNMGDWVSNNPDGTKEWAGPNAVNATVKLINYSDSGGSNSGKGDVAGGCYTTFASNFWWDAATSRPYAWMINFSTKDITTDQLSMQISVCNADQNFYKPRFWKAEWSTVDSMAAADDDKWKPIGEYTVPDLGIWSNTLISATNAYKYINLPLPLEMLGKENVYIRLVPRDTRASSGAAYADSFIYEGTAGKQASVLAYFAIRYNK